MVVDSWVLAPLLDECLLVHGRVIQLGLELRKPDQECKGNSQWKGHNHEGREDLKGLMFLRFAALRDVGHEKLETAIIIW